MNKYFVLLNGKIIKSYVRKSFAVAKFNKLVKTIDISCNLIEVWHLGFVIFSTGSLANFNLDNLFSDHGC